MIHFLLLGGYFGAAVSAVGILRETVFLNQSKRWAKSKLWLLFFVLCSIGPAALTWKSLLSILPSLASVLSVFGFLRSNPRLSRWMAFPISGCMLTYNVTCASSSGIVNEILTLISAAVGVVRYSKEKKKA